MPLFKKNILRASSSSPTPATGSPPSLAGVPQGRLVHAGIGVNLAQSHTTLDLDLGALGIQEPLLRSEEQAKFVFAHFMVGNTYPYTQEDWLEDLKLASEHDIDGFVLNIGVETWQKDRVIDCFKASEKLPKDVQFTFLFSFDMTSIPGNATQDVCHLASYLSSLATHPRMFKHPRSRRVVVSTFSGQDCCFGQSKLEDGWSYVKRELSAITPIDLMPAFFVDPAQYPGIRPLDGVFNWNGGWPVHLTPSLHRREIDHPKLDSDGHHLHHLDNNKSFMAAVSPWFFTHYGPNSWNKNWIYRGDDWLFVRRWEQLIEMRDRIEFVQVISWNDYGESHYIGPIKGAQPNSEAWVDGYPHEPWLHLNSYFARAFKVGVYPDINKDQIFVWARPHPKDAVANEDVPRPTNWELTDDLMWIIIFATTPAIVKISTSNSPKDMRDVDVRAGMTKLSSPLKVGGGIRVIMTRGGKVVAECVPVGYRFEARPGVYNFNAFVAMSE
ncbi:glycoside hydrolase family 71 protein [Macrolepiota fuliginosa MF-IS2]|uniref:Glycoside hydrolase family 71 protein n=1 Tax=Macrolepiota fuliginosa MF-IS2 TaxID=1400762 RepID=A0A9P6C161_9AGAR|nr:glycoside hydrolase family 71 protein [Macrolepiota fuliginosa MF-IS2]